SYAGAVVGGVARRIPHRIRAQVYVDTMPLAEGASRLDGFSPEGQARFEGAVRTVHGTRVWPVPEPLGSQAPGEGLSPSDIDLIRSRGTPHPALVFEERLTGPVKRGPYPTSYAISCVEDDPAGVSARPAFLSTHPGWRYDHLVTDHWPRLSLPDDLAPRLDRIARD
ncbi:esterase, partial [mine drainage metagenome]